MKKLNIINCICINPSVRLSIYHDYTSYCVKYDFTLGWDIQRFRVLLKHIFENDFECFHKLVDEDAIKWAKCGAFSSEEEAWKFSWNQVFPTINKHVKTLGAKSALISHFISHYFKFRSSHFWFLVTFGD